MSCRCRRSWHSPRSMRSRTMGIRVHDGRIGSGRPAGARDVEVAQADPLQVPTPVRSRPSSTRRSVSFRRRVDGVPAHVFGDKRRRAFRRPPRRRRRSSSTPVFHGKQDVGHSADVLLVIWGVAQPTSTCGEMNIAIVHHEVDSASAPRRSERRGEPASRRRRRPYRWTESSTTTTWSPR